RAPNEDAWLAQDAQSRPCRRSSGAARLTTLGVEAMIDRARLLEASAMWKSGALAREVAAHLGVKIEALGMMCTRNRGLFPHRAKHRAGRKGNRVRTPQPTAEIAAPAENVTGRMQWITEDGVSVTLPRISLIECPRGHDR